jgi:outer membrane protein OmpA-like peptidoglycan-associated protein
MESERLDEAAPQQAEPTTAQPASAGLDGAGASPSVARVLALQRSAGNAAVTSMLSRQVAPNMTPAAEPTTDQEAIEQAEAFFRSGPFEGTVIPGEGNSHGGFDATYDPPAGMLTIKMKVGVDFKNGIEDDGTTATANDASMAPVAAHANTLAGPDRAAFVAQYAWQEPEKEPWRNDLRTTIGSTWGGKFEFFLNKPGFEWIGAQVRVDLDVHDAVSSGSDHLTVTALKTPPGTNLYEPMPGTSGTFSRTNEGDPNNAFDQSMVVASTDLGQRPDVDFLNHSVWFGHDQDSLDGTATAELDKFITTFNGAQADARSVHMPVTLVGHTSSSGSAGYNQGLSDRRVAAVREYFNSHGFDNVSTRVSGRGEGETGANPVDDPNDRRVDVTAGDGTRQSLIAHEFGHAFGLDDEYVLTGNAGYVGGGTGQPVGTAASHDAATKEMTNASGGNLPGAIHENSDSIMSLGSVVRPQHYSTFHRALEEITAQNPWALGTPQAHPLGRTPAP